MMSWLLIATAKGANDALAPLNAFIGKLFSLVIPLIIVIGVLSLAGEMLKPVRRRRRRRTSRSGGSFARGVVVVIVAFGALEYWLWNHNGLGGCVLAVVIPLFLVTGAVCVAILDSKRRKSAANCSESTMDGEMQPSSPVIAEDVGADDAVAVRAGEQGEAMVRATIKSLPADRYVVLHDVWLPMEDGGVTQIDHVVVSPFGIFVIETKNWKGMIYADAKSVVWTKFNHGQKMTFKNPIRQNYKHIVSIREKFTSSGSTEFVFGIVAMSPDADFRNSVPQGVVFYNELKSWILGHSTSCIKPEQIADIVAVIQEWSSTVSEDERRQHCGVF